MRALSEGRNVDITGKMMPWHVDHPVMVKIEGQDFVPIYSTAAQLHASMLELRVPVPYTVKRISNGREFMDSLNEQRVHVCLDAHRVGAKTRFTLCM